MDRSVREASRRHTREPGAPGGPGVIPLSVPNIAGNEWDYVRECLESGWVSSVGAWVDRFEREHAAIVGAPHAVAMGSGTASLHVALSLSGVGDGDEVIVPALTFIAPANAVRYLGAWPVFVDVEEEYWQLDPLEVKRFLEEDCRREDGVTRNRHTGRRVAAILPVDLLGHPSDLDAFEALGREYGLAVVEDAAEAVGAQYKGHPVGHGGAITCFSFNGNKIVTTGGGGMLVTRNEDTARMARYLSTQAKDDSVEYIHGTVGFNYRLTNVQAAIGCAQLEQLDRFVARKREIARFYHDGLAAVPGIRLMREAPWAASTFWLYTVLVNRDIYGMNSRELLAVLEGAGIQTRPLWQPLNRSPAHEKSFARPCPVADLVSRDALSLPSSTNLTEAEQQRVVDALRDNRRASSIVV